MARLLLALLLALGLHLLLFRMMIPVREIRPPWVSGPGQVKVRLARPAPSLPEKANEKPAAEATPSRLEVPAPAAPAVREQRPPDSAAQRPLPEKKKALPAGDKSAEQPAPATPPPADRHSRPTPADAGTGKADIGGETFSAQEASPAPLREAVPLAADNRPPEYPTLARKRGWEGRVLLAVQVATDGTAGAVRVQAGSGHELLDEAALRAVRSWRFQPATRDGEALAMEVLVPVQFILRDTP